MPPSTEYIFQFDFRQQHSSLMLNVSTFESVFVNAARVPTVSEWDYGIPNQGCREAEGCGERKVMGNWFRIRNKVNCSTTKVMEDFEVICLSTI